MINKEAKGLKSTYFQLWQFPHNCVLQSKGFPPPGLWLLVWVIFYSITAVGQLGFLRVQGKRLPLNTRKWNKTDFWTTQRQKKLIFSTFSYPLCFYTKWLHLRKDKTGQLKVLSKDSPTTAWQCWIWTHDHVRYFSPSIWNIVPT